MENQMAWTIKWKVALNSLNNPTPKPSNLTSPSWKSSPHHDRPDDIETPSFVHLEFRVEVYQTPQKH